MLVLVDGDGCDGCVYNTAEGKIWKSTRLHLEEIRAARMDFWGRAYCAELGADGAGASSKRCALYADDALSEFDKRFKEEGKIDEN